MHLIFVFTIGRNQVRFEESDCVKKAIPDMINKYQADVLHVVDCL